MQTAFQISALYAADQAMSGPPGGQYPQLYQNSARYATVSSSSVINSHTSTSDAVVINGGVINNNNVVYTAYARNNSVTIDDAATIDASKPVYTY